MTHFSLLIFFLPVASAAGITCLAGAASIPVLNPLDGSAAVGDYTLMCGGGDPVDPLPLVNVETFLNVVVLHIGTPILTDGVNNYSGAFGLSNQIIFSGVTFNPVGINFEFENIFVDPSAQAPGFEFREFADIVGTPLVTISNPDQLVAVNASVPEPSTLSLVGIASSAIMLLIRLNYKHNLKPPINANERG